MAVDKGVGFDLRDDADDVAANVADIVQPLLETLQAVYSPAAVAVILDTAAKCATYEAAVDAPSREAALELQRVMREQRELVREAGRRTEQARPLTAEMLW
jgi:hypothetical protein